MRQVREGEIITIQSYKHDGSIHRTWKDNLVLKTSEHSIIVCNDHTLVTEANGRKWKTREPALVYFHDKYWFNIVTMIRKTGISYYCNLASPFVIDDLGIKYIDYDLDIKVFPDGDKKLLDIDEYIKHGEKWDYPKEIDYILRESVKILVDWIENGKGPFSDGYVKLWYDRYCELNN
ncbi:MAG: DUF402 domain-containing protein [Atopococcus tabaci]|uniref:DUF402 domain-containing protein n=1 Tax=Atopococcus tabaci TaxID=269774 RepID=A0AA43UCU4_9LACT|nr:DUF402 domain-containing protein [Atopococcus tabaci]